MIVVDILINDKSWNQENSKIKAYLRNLLNVIIPQTKLKYFLEKNIEIEVSLLLTNDAEIQELNKNYRKKDKPTNVLSFPVLAPKVFENITDFKGDFMAIGDIVLSFQTLKRETIEQNKIFNNHLTHLLIHSILHLIGYDHETESEAKIMENLEIEILKNLAIDNPYIIPSSLRK